MKKSSEPKGKKTNGDRKENKNSTKSSAFFISYLNIIIQLDYDSKVLLLLQFFGMTRKFYECLHTTEF